MTGAGIVLLDFQLDGRLLQVEVRPLDAPGPAYASTRRFKVSYRGAGDLEPRQHSLLSRFVQVLAGVEHGLPTRFAPGVLVGEGHAEPHRR